MDLTIIFQTLNITYYVAAGLLLLKTCTILVLEIYVPYLSDPLGKDAYYIKQDDESKIYLIKSLNKLEILGYSHPRLKKIDKNNPENNYTRILKKDDVKNTVIFRERYQDSLLDRIKSWISK
ncbi:hypothetical protein COA05_30425 [Bacillus thuringiensis]|uniref:hypothetical protein n=1 Tax=Bacillus thuringiensis TaxID=1428 RepID=UPI000BFDB63A|nr:hypothetical protein [Bacillus thuringiensis]PGQ09647.1 hypothetical protein COA05_30425 [Bacillus thuringiensis]